MNQSYFCRHCLNKVFVHTSMVLNEKSFDCKNCNILSCIDSNCNILYEIIETHGIICGTPEYELEDCLFISYEANYIECFGHVINFNKLDLLSADEMKSLYLNYKKLIILK